jgi:hypothetical protein
MFVTGVILRALQLEGTVNSLLDFLTYSFLPFQLDLIIVFLTTQRLSL